MEERLEAGKDSKVEKRCKPPAIPTAPSIIPADTQSGRERGGGAGVRERESLSVCLRSRMS